MTPTTRNSLMVGGALIVIALLLTCGPIRGIFGAGDAGTSADVATSDATPLRPVGAALPVNTDAALAAATTGAVAGSQIGSADTAAVASEAPETVAPVLVAGAAVAAAEAAGAADAGASVAAASTDIVPPAVSASPPSVPVSTSTMAGVVDPAIALAASAAAASAFDDAFDHGFAGDMADMPAEGVVVGRFAPPVAAISSQLLALNGVERAVGIGAAGVRAPCDSPGVGCRKLQVATASPIPINPPIVPGPTPPPIRINPPIVSGPTPPPPIRINPPVVSGPTPP